MLRVFCSLVAGGVLVALTGWFATEAQAQRANIPGVIGGAVEGDIGGAAGAALGYGYYGRTGYYPGARDRYGWSPYDARRPYGYHGGQFNRGPYDRRYDPRLDGRYYSGYRGTPGLDVRRYRSAPAQAGMQASPNPAPRLENPSPEAEFYRAVIVNPEETRATLRFTVNGRPYELKPGESKEFSGRMYREIRFDRGKDGAMARYALSDGRYTFAATDKGWELYRHSLEDAEETAMKKPAIEEDATEKETEQAEAKKPMPPQPEQQKEQGAAAASQQESQQQKESKPQEPEQE